MDAARETNDEQTTLWNGVAGTAWVNAGDLIDGLLAPFEDVLVETVLAGNPNRVLDVGCGTGGVTVALARALGPDRHCVGVDISEPMIAEARARAEREGVPASFIRADAQRYAFEPASFDMIASRFGVMFFDDFVQAFENLRRAARDGGELRFIAWRGAPENPFMTTAERAAAPLLPNLPHQDPAAPGRFALADADRVRGALQGSDWTAIDIRPIDVTCTMPETALIGYLTQFGPVGRALHDADDQTRAKVTDTVRAAYEPFVHETEVRFTAAGWIIAARAGGDRPR